MRSMPTPAQIPITEFRNLDETNKNLLIWTGLTDTWGKLMETIEHQKEIEADTRVHNKLLITGNGEPSIMERVRSLEKFEDTFQYWAKFIGGALLLNFLGFSIGIFVAIVRFFPVLEALAKKP